MSKEQLIIEAQDNYVKAMEDYTKAKAINEKIEEAKEKLVEVCGVGHHFKDKHGVVHIIEDAPKGHFVYYKTHTVNRTKNEVYGDTTKGSLSAVKAKELGYEL